MRVGARVTTRVGERVTTRVTARIGAKIPKIRVIIYKDQGVGRNKGRRMDQVVFSLAQALILCRALQEAKPQANNDKNATKSNKAGRVRMVLQDSECPR